MASERIPCEFIDDAMILMQVFAIVRKNQIGGNLFLQSLKILFDGLPVVREETLAKSFHDYGLGRSASEETGGALERFFAATSIGAEDDPSDVHAGMIAQQV